MLPIVGAEYTNHNTETESNLNARFKNILDGKDDARLENCFPLITGPQSSSQSTLIETRRELKFNLTEPQIVAFVQILTPDHSSG